MGTATATRYPAPRRLNGKGEEVEAMSRERRVRLLVREVAGAQGFTIYSLSLASRVAHRTVKAYWWDQIRYIDTVTLQRLADALHVAPGALIGPDDGHAGRMAPLDSR